MRRALLIAMCTVATALGLAASAGAVDAQMAVTEEFFNPCTGEMFLAQGTLKVTSEFTIGADGRLHERFHYSLQAMTAKGVISSAKYVVQRQTSEGTNADADSAPSTMHLIFKEHYVRSGENGSLFEGDDFYVWFHMHMTINSNGVPTAFKIDSEEEPCQ